MTPRRPAGAQRGRRPAAPVPFDPDQPGRPGDGIFGLPHSLEDSAVVVVPVPYEATVSYGSGTSDGPEAIRDASLQVDLHDTHAGAPYRAGIAMEPVPASVRRWSREARAIAEPVIRAGGASGKAAQAAARKVDAYCERMNRWVQERTASALGRGRLPAVVGGDHSVSFGAIAACAEAHPGLGVLHLDAHADLRQAYEGFTWSHASIMHNVLERIPGVTRLIQVGLRDIGRAEERRIRESNGRARAFFDADIALDLARGRPFSAIAAAVVEPLPEAVYVSFDIDALDPSLCPGTGTPVPGGLSWHQAVLLLATLAGSGRRIVGLDLTEVAPSPAGGEWDANVGARLLYKMIGFALLSREASPAVGPAAPVRRR